MRKQENFEMLEKCFSQFSHFSQSSLAKRLGKPSLKMELNK